MNRIFRLSATFLSIFVLAGCGKQDDILHEHRIIHGFGNRVEWRGATKVADVTLEIIGEYFVMTIGKIRLVHQKGPLTLQSPSYFSAPIELNNSELSDEELLFLNDSLNGFGIKGVLSLVFQSGVLAGEFYGCPFEIRGQVMTIDTRQLELNGLPTVIEVLNSMVTRVISIDNKDKK